MGLFSLLTKPLRILDVAADVVEDTIDEVAQQAVDYLRGDWAGEDRDKRD